MQTSKHAPKLPSESLAQSKASKLKNDKARATRLLGRLRWKAELLMASYWKAIESINVEKQHSEHDQSKTPNMKITRAKHVESMFRIDFFEWYTLLERYITDCLAIFGVTVSGTAPKINFNALKLITNPELRRTHPLASHAFHANLLEALDDEACPLHHAFGVQHIRVQLGLAKDYRNAWKDANKEDGTSHSSKHDELDRRKNVELHDLQLEHMLTVLIEGAEHSHAIVQAHENPNANGTTTPRQHAGQDQGMMEIEEDLPFEFMEDAMDLD